jgi:hypothetical protein
MRAERVDWKTARHQILPRSDLPLGEGGTALAVTNEGYAVLVVEFAFSHQKFTVARKTGGGFCVGILWGASQNKHTLLISFPCIFRTVFREFWWFRMDNWMVRR